MLYRGALYSNLHTHDFVDAALRVDNSLGHWQLSLHYPFVRGKGGGRFFVPPSNKRMTQKSLPVPGDTFALRGNGDFYIVVQ